MTIYLSEEVMQATALIVIFALVVIASFFAAPRRATVDGFFGGMSGNGSAPGLWVLVLSQVTTWIFARSLMNAAILGYFYGIVGTLAYAGYYASFQCCLPLLPFALLCFALLRSALLCLALLCFTLL